MPWVYWLCVSTFLVVFAVSAISAFLSEKEKDRAVDIACSIIFLTFGGGGFLWPILRKKESNAIRTEFVHSFNMHCEAVVFPMSRVKQFIIIAGAAAISTGVGILLLFADNSETEVKAIIGFILYVSIAILALKSLFGARKGILLVPGGVIWNEMFLASCFIPWDVIQQSAHFLKKDKGSLRPVSTFGINVFDPALLQTSKWSRKRFSETRKRKGWYFLFFQETILFPLETIAKTVEFYRRHPEARGEIGTANSIARINVF